MLRATWSGHAGFGLSLLCLSFLCTPAALGTPVEQSSGSEREQASSTPAEHSPATSSDGQSSHQVSEMGPSDAELAELRGGKAIVIANQELTAIAAGNSIGGDAIAGAVSLSGSALSNFNGLGNIVINTGSQVSLQSGMNLTINVNP